MLVPLASERASFGDIVGSSAEGRADRRRKLPCLVRVAMDRGLVWIIADKDGIKFSWC